jgi:hypothetical protein
MVRAALAVSLTAATLTGAAAAIAQLPVATPGNYGGGAVLSPPKSLGAPGNMLIGLRVGGNRVQLNASVAASCESLSFSASAALGTPAVGGVPFKVTGTKRARLSGGRSVVTTYAVQGFVADVAGLPGHPYAGGTARVRNRITTPGRATRTCTSGKVGWAARRPSGDLGASGITGGEYLYGTTSQRREGPRRAIMLRVSRDGTKLLRALYDADLRCAGRTIRGIYDAPRRNLPISPIFTVRDVEHFTYRTRTTIAHDTERFEATLGKTGAHGTFSIVSRLADRRSGRTISTCASGTVRFTAST